MNDDDVSAHNHASAYVTTFAYPSVLCCLAGGEWVTFDGNLQQTYGNTAGELICLEFLFGRTEQIMIVGEKQVSSLSETPVWKSWHLEGYTLILIVHNSWLV